MSEPASVSKADLLNAFLEHLKKCKEKEMASFSYLLENSFTEDMLTKAFADRDQWDVDRINEIFGENRKEIEKAVAELLGGSTGSPGTVGDMEATSFQAETLDRHRRARIGRNTSRVRRKYHALTRRRSHGIEGGLIDRRLESHVVSILKAAKA